MSKFLTRRTLLAATAATLAAAALPMAVSRADSLVRVDVYDRTASAALPIHRHQGRRYVAGEPGHEYAVRIRNCTNERVLAVLSVDGVNAVTGETAAPGQSGHVIEPGGHVTVEGWRKSLDRTAAFYFSDPGDAYATRTGRPDDLGVIGVALFRERSPDPPAWWSGRAADDRPATQERAARSTAAGAMADSNAAAPGTAAEASLGTGHGRSEYSPVRQVRFERAGTRPDETFTLRYERRETLVAMGVLPDAPRVERHPDPFPGALSFVPDP